MLANLLRWVRRPSSLYAAVLAIIIVSITLLMSLYSQQSSRENEAPISQDPPALEHNYHYRTPQFFEKLDARSQGAIQEYFRQRIRAQFDVPSSCVYNCSSVPRVFFKLPEGTSCQANNYCKYRGLRSFHYDPNEYLRFAKQSKVSCKRAGYATCNFPRKNDCDDHGWREWVVNYVQGHRVNLTTRFFAAQYLPGRPFMINNIFETDERPNRVKVVSFFLPTTKVADGCNTLYCFYEYPSGKIERHEAIPGDMSFTYCKPPQLNESRALLRLSYDHQIISHPFLYSIDQTAKSLPHVFLSLCAIVKREGKNLKEWMAFHFMMGYDRIILYDNNEEGEIDEAMERYLKKFPEKIIRYRWPFLHAQTEQSTDCVLRFGSTSTWMTFIDVDEFLVPSAPHKSIRELLKKKYKNDPILQATWTVFGPCGNEPMKEGELTMERCKNIYPYPFPLHKATFQPRLAAGMQAIGPHFPRLKADVGVKLRSTYRLVNEDMRTYHYRFKTLPEFLERRMGSAADRIITQDINSLMQDWNFGVSKSYNISDKENQMLRFIPKLKKEVLKYRLP
eukprot:TRINITY_DN5278_c0_g1_i1.p1 TRINITY_DN5278_c0_g1~~TRINITY_DN5278_c0_g1_i1.p1  ORF type:complete len:562 (+),score=90.67 TRINITY_DN5278_c0_g1_i1:117-1802(+)